MYSIIEQGGIQFKAIPGATIRVPLLAAEKGSDVSIERVLLTVDGDNIKVGTPCIKGASVTAKVVDHCKADKVLIIKMKRRKDYRRKNGHRQQYTKLQIVSING